MTILTAILHREEEIYVAECPDAGTVSRGETNDEALQNQKEATEMYLEEIPMGGPTDTFHVKTGTK